MKLSIKIEMKIRYFDYWN